MNAPVVVVGATGHLGGRVVHALVARGTPVRALVRDGTDPGPLLKQGVEIVRGNLLDPPSLDRALDGARALVPRWDRRHRNGPIDISAQAELFGPVARIEDSLRRALEEARLLGGA